VLPVNGRMAEHAPSRELGLVDMAMFWAAYTVLQHSAAPDGDEFLVQKIVDALA